MTSLTESPNNMEAHLNSQVPPLNLMSDEDAALEESSELDDPETLDLSGHGLTKLGRAAPGFELTTMTLLLDNNSLQRLDNIHTYQCIEKLSACNNQLLRMFQVSKLNHLKILNLSGNNVVTMEGLKELKLLTWLSLSNNKIKAIENLSQNVHLEHLDLSGNLIVTIASDLSYLKNLKVLLLHRNKINSLKGCERYLPTGVTTLTLNSNELEDLTEVSFLNGLIGLEQLTLTDNLCIEQPEDERKQFDYRPFVINWCLSLRVLDGIMVGAKESLKAEWMYSQSKGRQYSVGQHSDLVDYLLSVCPLHPGEDWEEDKKLNLILSKVQEHQQSLREPGSAVMSPRSNTLPRPSSASVASPMRFTATNSSRASSASTTPTATPSVPRRSSFTHGGHQKGMTSSLRRSSLSRTSPSPVRRRNVTPTRVTKATPPGSYALALPRTLYGDDINGNNSSGNMMTQSMDPGKLAGRLDNGATPTSVGGGTTPQQVGEAGDLMTASLDPVMLMENIQNIQEYRGKSEAWAKDKSSSSMVPNRPNSLFASSDGVSQDLKDLYLQDLSDNEVSQSLMYSRLQTRLNPVPESLNSPDLAPPGSASGLGRPPAKDDPIRVYNRDLAVSSSTVSTASSSSNNKANKASLPISVSKELAVSKPAKQQHNGYSSSSDEEIKQHSKAKSDIKAGKIGPVNSNNQKSSTTAPAASKSAAATPSKPTDATRQSTNNKTAVSSPRPTSAKRGGPPNKNLSEVKKQSQPGNNCRSPETRKRSLPLTTNKSKDKPNDDVDDSSRSEASISEQQIQRDRVRKSRKARSGSSTRLNKNEVVPRQMSHSMSARGLSTSDRGKYAPEKYSDKENTAASPSTPKNNRSKKATERPVSATNNKNVMNNNRPRSNTINTVQEQPPVVKRVPPPVKRPESGYSSTSGIGKSPRAHSAASTMQKTWRGHSAKERDAERVRELKDEVRSLRSEEHIKHLTKELASAKQALEKERKLRSLQMDAIKVLWKEVQLMDEVRSAPTPCGGPEPTRPSGSGGSKISSRSSEHSIAKLMETLEATAGPQQQLTSIEESKDNNSMMMAQSMPASVMSGQLADDNVVENLSKTCNNLQNQVEQLQSSLSGVMQFMSAFSSVDVQQQRTRNSSTASTADTVSFSYYHHQPLMAQSMGPMSLPPETVVSGQDGIYVKQPQPQPPQQQEDQANLAMSRSCDCLTQTEISAVLTPRNEQMPPNPSSQFLHLKRVPIDSSDSEPAVSSQHVSRHDVQNNSNTIAVNNQRDRSKSPRPQTLPGLKKTDGTGQGSIPGLVQLAGNALLKSPQAPQQVKAYAKNLVDGLLTDTITKAVSDSEDPNNSDGGQNSNPATGGGEETDVSLSLNTEEPEPFREGQSMMSPANKNDETKPVSLNLTGGHLSPSSHVDTDSLDETNDDNKGIKST